MDHQILLCEARGLAHAEGHPYLASTPMRRRSNSVGSDDSEERTTDREAVQMLLDLLKTHMSKRSFSDIACILADPSIFFRLVPSHRKRYCHMLEGFEELDLLRAVTPGSECARDARIDADGFLPRAAVAALYARAAYGAVMRRGSGDKVNAFIGGAAKSAVGKFQDSDHLKAFLELADVPAEDVLLSSWYERTFEPAFVVFFDRKLQWLVVTIRGSMEWKSVLTDVAAETCEVAGGLSHSGMVRAARWVLNAARPILNAALDQHPEYELVCTGHSLGADVAAVLALLLREEEVRESSCRGVPQCSAESAADAESISPGCSSQGVPASGVVQEASADVSASLSSPSSADSALSSAVAYAIAPSPLLTPELAERCAPFVLSILKNVDYITRMSVFAMDRLILELTERSAAKVATNWIMSKFGQTKPGVQSNASSARGRAFGHGAEVPEVLVTPGRLLHMNCLGIDRSQELPRIYHPMPGFYHEIFINPQMFHDHLPIRYVEDLLCILSAAVPWHAPQLHLERRASDPEAEHHVLTALRALIAEQRSSPECVARLVRSAFTGGQSGSDAPGYSGQSRCEVELDSLVERDESQEEKQAQDREKPTEEQLQGDAGVSSRDRTGSWL